MTINTAETFEQLFDKNNNAAYKALQILVYRDIQKAVKEIQKL